MWGIRMNFRRIFEKSNEIEMIEALKWSLGHIRKPKGIKEEMSAEDKWMWDNE